MFQDLKICRFCFSKKGPFFDMNETGEGKKNIKRQIYNALTITVTTSCYEHVLLCKTCHDLIQAFFHFKAFCLDSEKVLKNLLSKSEMPTDSQCLPKEVLKILHPSYLKSVVEDEEEDNPEDGFTMEVDDENGFFQAANDYESVQSPNTTPKSEPNSDSVIISQNNEMFSISSVQSMNPNQDNFELDNFNDSQEANQAQTETVAHEKSQTKNVGKPKYITKVCKRIHVMDPEKLNKQVENDQEKKAGTAQYVDKDSNQGESILGDTSTVYTVKEIYPTFRCDFCHKNYSTQEFLNVHNCQVKPTWNQGIAKPPGMNGLQALKRLESKSKSKLYKIKCIRCDMLFSRKEDVREHLKKHDLDDQKAKQLKINKAKQNSQPIIIRAPINKGIVKKPTVIIRKYTPPNTQSAPSTSTQVSSATSILKLTPSLSHTKTATSTTSSFSPTLKIPSVVGQKQINTKPVKIIRRYILPKGAEPVKVPIISSVFQLKPGAPALNYREVSRKYSNQHKHQQYIINDSGINVQNKRQQPKTLKIGREQGTNVQLGHIQKHSYQMVQQSFEDHHSTDEEQFVVINDNE